MVGKAKTIPRERNGALLRVHAVVCSKTLDTADIVREAMFRQSNFDVILIQRKQSEVHQMCMQVLLFADATHLGVS